MVQPEISQILQPSARDYYRTKKQELVNNNINTMKFSLYTLFLALLFLPLIGNAKSYQVSLFYDKAVDEIRLDKFISEPVQLQDTDDTLSIYERADLSVGNNFQVNLEAYQYTFPQTLVYPYKEGAFVINVPYFPHVKAINIKSQNGKTLNIDVSRDSKCNQNNVCEYEKGEDNNTCISDCLGPDVKFSEETQKMLQKENGVIRDESGTVLLSANTPASNTDTASEPEQSKTLGNIAILIGGIVFLAGGLGLFIWKLRKR
jgi:hypothetical protein